MRIVVIAALGCLAGELGEPGTAHAQPYFADEPTDGIALPTAPLAGEHDARTVATNPGGLALIRGTELALALALEDRAVATSAGQGFGAFWARSIGGRFLPRFGVGLGLEWLRPPSRSDGGQLAHELGQPFRLTLGLATPLGAGVGFGVAWHHFVADGLLARVDTFDLGLSLRLGSHAAVGATLRDLATSRLGELAVQRRYEAELMVRPLGSAALEASLGGRLGEDRHDVDGWLRLGLRLVRGVYLRGELETRELRIVDAGMPGADRSGRDLRATLGLELSFGGVGVTSLVSGLRDDRRTYHALGAGLVLRSSSAGPASVLGTADHIERVDLAGDIGSRELTAIVVRLRAIARDATARAVVVTFDGVSAGWATLDELRAELVALRAAGKKLFAYMVSGTSRDYYVATAAHKIYIDPAGGVRLVGMAGTTMYFRGAFEQFGVLPQFEKIAEYKSAPEQFTEAGPTDVAAKMRNDLLDSMWQRWVATVAEARKLTPGEVIALVDGGPYSAGDLAADTRLVDAVAPPDKISQLVTAEIGAVLPLGRPPVERPERWTRPGVAIVYVDGDITDGKSRSLPVLGQSMAGGETLIAALAAARGDPRVGAIILRINSPGGSALASELIAREVFATRGTKPILCSLGNTAASGGYFIAAGCDVIFAEPMTITGSIGIFYGKFDIGGLAKKLGITSETWKRGKRADIESMFRPYTADERALLKDKLRYLYGRFVGAVSEGRGIQKADVDAIGRGHVWTGAQAQPLKLVDRFGGLNDAIDEAKRRMGIGDAQVQLYELPNLPTSLLGSLAGLLGISAEAPPLELTDLPVIKQLLEGVPASLLVAPGSAQARLPFDIRWD